MKRIVLIIMGVLTVILLVAATYLLYSYLSAPAIRAREKQANVVATRAQKQTKTALKTSSGLKQRWQSLPFDDPAEAFRIIDDINNSRGYKVDNRRDAAAAAVHKDITDSEKSLKTAELSIKQAHKQLLNAYALRLPWNKAQETNVALRNNEASAKELKRWEAGLKELKSDNDVWGFFAMALRLDALTLDDLRAADTALNAGDYGTASDTARAVLDITNESVTWMTKGKQELANIGVYSRDADTLLEFVSQAKETAELYDQAANFGKRNQPDSLKQTSDTATAKMTTLSRYAQDNFIGQDYKTWFLANAARHLK